MDIRVLHWDSDFFNLRIGRMDLETKADEAELQSRHIELKQHFDLLYIFDANAVGFEADGARLVDEKILYGKPCEPGQQFAEVSLYQDATPSDDLYRAALVSRGYSRFKLDERLPKRQSYVGFWRQYFTPWVIGGYVIMICGLVLNIFCMSKGVQVKGVSTIESLSYLFVPCMTFLLFRERII